MEKLNATKHYLHYPKGDFPPFLAYGFRPIFLFLAPYMVLNILLWALFWAGALPLSFLSDPVKWHIYELLYGVGSAGIMAFLLTGLPELFPGVVPVVSKKLAFLVFVWLLGRVSFWCVDFLPLALVGFINVLSLLFMIFYAFKPVVLDKSQKHSSLAYNIVIITLLQIAFFLGEFGYFDSYSILNLSLGAYMALILLALRRINTEVINEWLEDRGIDDILLVRPPRYNLAIFCIALFTLAEFFYPQNTATGWLALAAGAGVFGTLSEYKMKDSFILFEPYVLYLASIIVIMAVGYIFMGMSFFYDIGSVSSYKHFLTIGAFGIAFYMVLVIVSFVHTGRHLKASWFVSVGVIGLILSACVRVLVNFYPEFAVGFYIISSLLWVGAFGLYFVKFWRFLLNPRADGIKG